MKRIYTLIIAISLFSCNSKTSTEKYARYREKGREISSLTQSVLLASVGQAIKEGGPVYAVEFCNLKAMPIVDSLNKVNNCKISRISDKNRNPGNSLKTETDKKLWEVFKGGTVLDTVVSENESFVYYKTIKTGMDACLKCHGVPETDINSETLSKLQKLYPEDLATGYKLNDFRGLWKIEFVQN